MDPVRYIAGIFTDYETKSNQKGLVAQVLTALGKTSHELLRDLETQITIFMPVMARFDAAMLEQMRTRIIKIENNDQHPTVLKIDEAIKRAKGEPEKEELIENSLRGEEKAQVPSEAYQNPKRKKSRREAGKRDSVRFESTGIVRTDGSSESSQSPKRQNSINGGGNGDFIRISRSASEEETDTSLESSQSPKRKKQGDEAGRRYSVRLEFAGGEEAEVSSEPPQRSLSQSPKRRSSKRNSERKSSIGDTAETAV